MSTDNLNRSFRRPLLLGFLLLVIIVGFWHSSAELAQGVRILAYMELVLTVYYGLLLVVILRGRYSFGLALAVVLPFLSLMLMAMSHEETPAKVFIWIFTIPVLAYILLGKWAGFFVTLASSLIAFVAYSYRFSHDTQIYGFLYMSDSIICMSIIWGALHLYERNREKTAVMLHEMATSDELTGLYNRRMLHITFEHLAVAASRNNQVVGVVVIDLDHFKQVNDTWGHDAGDAVLAHAASVIKENLRKSDWGFRIGGEEFCLLITADSAQGVEIAVEELRLKISRSPCLYDDVSVSISITISAGISMCPDEGEELEILQKTADSRMYQAKEAGRNCVVSSDDGVSLQ
ncbi:MAG: GGDEF domain-containing protein [Gammaproteobacteria bacterium]|nr:GGDEF domain-containing protein [Gammaproteobacteria bacterium]